MAQQNSTRHGMAKKAPPTEEELAWEALPIVGAVDNLDLESVNRLSSKYDFPKPLSADGLVKLLKLVQKKTNETKDEEHLRILNEMATIFYDYIEINIDDYEPDVQNEVSDIRYNIMKTLNSAGLVKRKSKKSKRKSKKSKKSKTKSKKSKTKSKRKSKRKTKSKTRR